MVQRIPHPTVRAPSRRLAGEQARSAGRRSAKQLGYRISADGANAAAGECSDPRLEIDQALGDILRSVVALSGAESAFLMVARDKRSVEIAAAHRIRPGEILHAAVTRVAGAMNRALSERHMTLANRRGQQVKVPDSNADCEPDWIFAPFTAVMRISGVLCLQRKSGGRRLTGLDLEIIQALADQASTALAAVRTHDALSRLTAELDCGKVAAVPEATVLNF